MKTLVKLFCPTFSEPLRPSMIQNSYVVYLGLKQLVAEEKFFFFPVQESKKQTAAS